VIQFLTLLGLLLVAAGTGGASSRVLAPIYGFYLALGGGALVALMFFPALLTLFRKRREKAWLSLTAGVIALGAAGFLGKLVMDSPLRDVTTDTRSPPAFTYSSAKVQAVDPSLLDNSFLAAKAYDPGQAALQQAHFPQLQPLDTAIAPPQAFAGVLSVIQKQYPRWKIVVSDPNRLHLEAEVESPIFHLVDDVAVEARPKGAGTAIEIRSRSREEKSDLGVNAKRVLALEDALKALRGAR
jgi:uncharacterized protein (DUF1499 family)